MQTKRVSSEEIKRNYTQITGREALERLLAGEEVFSVGGYAWKISGSVVLARDYEIPVEHLGDTSSFETSALQISAFLDPEDDDWYVAPPFDARKEMLARPGEWVAKYLDGEGCYRYIGLDHYEMSAVNNSSLEQGTRYAPDLEVYVADGKDIDRAIPLDDADLAKLASLSKEGE